MAQDEILKTEGARKQSMSVDRHRPPFLVQFRLADVIVWVLGVGLSAVVWREASPHLFPKIVTSRLRLWLGNTRLLGLAASVLAIFLAIGLVRQAALLARRRDARWIAAPRAVAWRLLIALMLGGLAFEAADLLGRFDIAATSVVETSTRVLPIAVTTAVAGILAGLSSGGVQSTPRLGWLSTLCAAVAGIAIIADQSLVPYLVLIAIEAVRRAMPHPEVSVLARPAFSERILQAGVELSAALVGCLVLAIWLSRELRRPAPRADQRTGTLILMGATAAVVVTAVLLVSVTLPGLDEYFTDGLLHTLHGRVLLLFGLGFASLALGLAARAADRPGQVEVEISQRPLWRRIFHGFLTMAVCLFLLDVILARVLAFFGPVNGRWTEWIGLGASGLRWLADPTDALWLVLVLTQVWSAWGILRLLVSPTSLAPTPIDAILTDRGALARFATRWLALMALMLASMPVFVLSGIVAVHVALHVLP